MPQSRMLMLHHPISTLVSLSGRRGHLRSGSRRLRAHPRRGGRTSRVGQLLTGLVAVGIGVGLVIRAELGVASWDVLHVGLAAQTGWSVGSAAILTGAVVAVVATLLGERPRLGSLVPLVLIAPSIDATLLLVPPADRPLGQMLLLVTGMLALSAGVGAYVSSDHGAGPSDLLFLALARRGLSISRARFVVDGAAVLAGWSIGGPVGIGTVVVTAALGPMIGLAVRGFDLVPAREAIAVRDAAFARDQSLALAWELA